MPPPGHTSVYLTVLLERLLAVDQRAYSFEVRADRQQKAAMAAAGVCCECASGNMLRGVAGQAGQQARTHRCCLLCCVLAPRRMHTTPNAVCAGSGVLALFVEGPARQGGTRHIL